MNPGYSEHIWLRPSCSLYPSLTVCKTKEGAGLHVPARASSSGASRRPLNPERTRPRTEPDPPELLQFHFLGSLLSLLRASSRTLGRKCRKL